MRLNSVTQQKRTLSRGRNEMLMKIINNNKVMYRTNPRISNYIATVQQEKQRISYACRFSPVIIDKRVMYYNSCQ